MHGGSHPPNFIGAVICLRRGTYDRREERGGTMALEAGACLPSPPPPSAFLLASAASRHSFSFFLLLFS